MAEQFNLSTIDISVIIVYAIFIIWYGLKKSKKESSEDYFLGGRDMKWPIVGISLFAANISSTTLIGLSGDAYSTGISVYNYEWMAAVVLVFFAMFFLPFYLNSKVYTMPEFLERRFDGRSRIYFSLITLIGNVVIEMAAGLYAGSLLLMLVFPDVEIEVIVAILAFLAASYTIPGGLSSVVHTEVIQAIILFIASIVLTFACLNNIEGGWATVIENTPAEMLSLVRPASDPSVPWPGLLFGIPILGFYFWATNQFMVQRVLGAKNINEGRKGVLFAGLLKLPVLFFMVLPGTMARFIYPDLEQADMVYPTLVFGLLPQGMIGLVVAGLLAAMSSSVSATLNSASTLVTMDFIVKLKPEWDSKKLVRAGQVSTVILAIIAALWTPQILKFDSLFKYMQQVLGFIAPPIAAVFIIGLFWKKGNANGAFSALMTGMVISIFCILSQVFDWVPAINELHFLYIAPILFVICSVVMILVSLMGEESTSELIWKKEMFTAETAELANYKWYNNYRILSVILLIITAIVVISFA